MASWDDFLHTRLELDPARFVQENDRERLEGLPSSAHLLGDRLPLHYELEHGKAVVRLRLREGKARRLSPKILPRLDRPLRFTVLRGRSEVLRASSLDELEDRLKSLRQKNRRRHQKRTGRKRRR